MKVLVTGGCGYKGSVLVPKLLAANMEVSVIDTQWFGNYLPVNPNLKVFQGDVRTPMDEWFTDVDAVIHLASVANDPCCDLDPKLSWEIGPLASMLLIEKAILHGAKQFIYASSGSVYGVSEAEQVVEELPLHPISDYNKTKMVTERVLLSYKNKITVQIVRPATVCGYSPRMRLDVSVNMLAIQALKNGVMTVYGGTQIRPNIHIDDITDLYLFLLERGEEVQGIYNAGFENLSLLEIAEHIRIHSGAEIKVTETNDPRSYRLNSDKLLKTGFKPKKKISNAISELASLYREGKLVDDKKYYNLKMMKEQGV